MLRLSMLFFPLFYSPELMSQDHRLPASMISREDTLPPVAMASGRPGVAYPEMPQRLKARKTIFNHRGSKFILPAIGIAYGTAARFNRLPFRQWDHNVDREIRRRMDRKYDIDDIFQYGAPVLAYGLDFIPGIDSRHNLRDRTLIMATSFLFMGGTVFVLKSTTYVARPGSGKHNSFPSGHTAATMLSAHILYREYKDVTPWIGVCGYLMATTTGVFRMLNRAHWQSDVIAGAGIGLLSAEIGYMMLPVWHSILGINSEGGCLAALPVISARSLGVGLVCRF